MRGIYLTLLAILVSSCGLRYHDSISGNGNVKEEMITTDTITKLVLTEKMDVLLIPSDTMKVVLRADANLFEALKIYQQGSKLELYSDKLIRMAKAKELLVYGNTLEQISGSLKNSIRSTGSLDLPNLLIEAGVGTDIDLHGQFDTLRLRTGPGGLVSITGATRYIDIDALGGSDVFVDELTAKNGRVSAISASDVRVHITDSALFYAGSFADIRYRGRPFIQESRAEGLADIKPIK